MASWVRTLQSRTDWRTDTSGTPNLTDSPHRVDKSISTADNPSYKYKLACDPAPHRIYSPHKLVDDPRAQRMDCDICPHYKPYSTHNHHRDSIHASRVRTSIHHIHSQWSRICTRIPVDDGVSHTSYCRRIWIADSDMDRCTGHSDCTADCRDNRCPVRKVFAVVGHAVAALCRRCIWDPACIRLRVVRYSNWGKSNAVGVVRFCKAHLHHKRHAPNKDQCSVLAGMISHWDIRRLMCIVRCLKWNLKWPKERERSWDRETGFLGC